jgi:predicted porin
MNKKLIAAAIAAAVAAPTAALANDVTIYGVVHASVDYRTDDDPAIDGFDVVSRATRIGFKGTEDLSNGLKAIWKMEFQVDIADAGNANSFGDVFALETGVTGSPTVGQGNVNGDVQGNANLVTARNMYIGLAGGWGTALVGRHDTPYKMSTGKLDLFADQLGDYNSTIGFQDIRTGSAIAYVSPSFSGFSFAGAVVAPHVYDSAQGEEYDSDSLAGAYSLSANYDANGFFAAIAYEVLTEDWLDAWATDVLNRGRGSQVTISGQTVSGPAGCISTGLPAQYTCFVSSATGNVVPVGKTAWGEALTEDDTKWRVGLGWTGMGFTVGALYEDHSDILGFDGYDAQLWQISAGYTFGNTMVKGFYGQTDVDYGSGLGSADIDAWAIGLDHSLSKRTKAYIQYVDQTIDDKICDDGCSTFSEDHGGWSLGLIHSF